MQALIKRGILSYLIWALFGLILFLIVTIVPTIFENIFIFSIFVFFALFLPGWLLVRIFNIKTNDLISLWLITFILGLVFYFIINLFAIILGIDISLLLKIYYIVIPILWLIALLKELQKPSQSNSKQLQIKDIFKLENLYYILPFFVGFFIIWVTLSRGPDLNGDPYFHLAIIRKAIDGNSLSPESLAFTKTSLQNPTTILPTWHIMLASISKTLSLDILVCWENIILFLTILSFSVWYFFAKVIFNKKAWAVLATLLFMIFIFYGGPGYIFSRLAVPDTFAQFILLPLGLALVFKYIFEKDLNWKMLVISVLGAISLLFVHATHYFYLVLIVFTFGLLYSIFYFKETDYKATLKKIFKVILAILAPLGLLAIFLELYSGMFSRILSAFTKAPESTISYDKFSRFGLTFQYGYFLLPFVFLFIKNKRIMIIPALLFLVPLVYETPLKDFLSKYLSFIFTDRLLSNTSLYFLVFALLGGCLLRLIDQFVDKLSVKIKDYLDFILFSLLGIIIIIGLNTEIISNFVYGIFYSKTTYSSVIQYTLAIFTISIIVAVLCWIINKKYWQKKELCKIASYKNILTIFILMAMISFTLITPSIKNANLYFSLNQSPSSQDFFLGNFKGDKEVINFIKTQLPVKSVLLTDSESLGTFSVMLDQYMAYNLGSAWDGNLNRIFQPNIPDWQKDELITSPKYAVDYIFVRDPKIQDKKYFENNPNLFKKIYDKDSQIYEVIK